MKKIQDQFTNLKVSRQRKWQLRHPQAQAVIKARYETSPKGRAKQHKCQKKHREAIESRIYNREYQRVLNYWYRRYLNAKSYQDERRVYAQ